MSLPEHKPPKIPDFEVIHPTSFVELLEVHYPYVLTGRENFEPSVEVYNFSEENTHVEIDALLQYLRDLRVLSLVDAELKKVNVHDRVEEIEVDITTRSLQPNTHSAEGSLMLIPFLNNALINITTEIDSSQIGLNPYEDDYGIASFLDDEEYIWAVNFWMNFNPENINHREARLNLTIFHEIRHIQHQLQMTLDWYRASKKAIDKHQIQSLPDNLALAFVRGIYAREKVLTVKEADAESYAIRALRGVVDGRFPKIITLR